jgi:hypothetical protein
MAAPYLDVAICDALITPVDFDTDADFIGITGKITQFDHMVSLAREFRARGKTVLIGGPFASLSPELVRPHCDVLVRGEIEDIAPKIFSDLACGRYDDEYVGGKPSLDTSPKPRWDLYPNDRSLAGTLQTSRGCPFECEFCDVIQYAGRKQRHKAPAQVVGELDLLYRHGYRSVFLADDNFTVYRSRARELLLAIREWNDRQREGKVSFSTQVSIDVAKDDELLRLCTEAGVTSFFIGIETPNESSLRETKKRQNMRVNLVDEVHAIIEHGILVVGGMIVGFDADDTSIFERQYDFAMASGIPIFSLGALVAPAATPLYERLKSAGRLKGGKSAEVAAVPWTTNIVHPKLSEGDLLGGLRWLGNNIYSPAAMGERLLVFIDKFGKRRPPRSREEITPARMRSVDLDSARLLDMVRELGPEEEKMWIRVMNAVAAKPDVAPFALSMLVRYMQIRYMYELGHFWEQQIAGAPVSSMLSKPNAPARAKGKSLPIVL